MLSRIILAASLLLLCSCGNLGYIVKTYGKPNSKLQHHESKEMAIRIFDRPDLKKMMVTPTVGRAFGIGAGAGATFGLWTPGMDPFPYQSAAQDWLNVNNRKSTITGGKLLVKPQWEFTYADSK